MQFDFNEKDLVKEKEFLLLRKMTQPTTPIETILNPILSTLTE